MFVPYAKSEDGFESHFAVNYLGHCLLTHLLLPHMIDTAKEKGSNCRIVNVSSSAHLAGSIDFKDLSMRYVISWISIWGSFLTVKFYQSKSFFKRFF
jgi:NAD(P)-dependent dehydrogenase (short-subunit alcohol dehydrogenase family)